MCQRMDYTFAVQLVCNNLNHMIELPSLIDHALAFNKAFLPALCIQCALLCLNSTHLKTYTDVKASCGPMNLEHSPITFNYKEIMKHLGFSAFSKISGLKMNGSGTYKAAGDFVSFKFEGQTIDVKFLQMLFMDFF